jgi:hypothetical protein
MQIFLPLPILCSCFDILGESSLSKQMPYKIFCGWRADDDRRDWSSEDPYRQHEVWEISNMVEMEVRQEDHVDIDRINSCAHQLVCGAVAAIEQIVTLPYGDQDGGMVSIGVNESSSGT